MRPIAMAVAPARESPWNHWLTSSRSAAGRSARRPTRPRSRPSVWMSGGVAVAPDVIEKTDGSADVNGVGEVKRALVGSGGWMQASRRGIPRPVPPVVHEDVALSPRIRHVALL